MFFKLVYLFFSVKRSRFKALSRELEDLDALEQKYMVLLNQLDPRWTHRAENARVPSFSVVIAKEVDGGTQKKVLADISNTFVPKNEANAAAETPIKSERNGLYESQKSNATISLEPDISRREEPLAQPSLQLKNPIVLTSEVEIPKVKVTTTSVSPVASSVIQSIDSLSGTGELTSTVGSSKTSATNGATILETEESSDNAWRPAGVRKVIRAPLQVQIANNHDDDDDDIVQDSSEELSSSASVGGASSEVQHVSSTQEENAMLDEPDESSLIQSNYPDALYISESAVSEILPGNILKSDLPAQVSMKPDAKAAPSGGQLSVKASEHKEAAVTKGLDINTSADEAEAKGLVRSATTGSAKDWKQSDKSSMDSHSLELHDALFGVRGPTRAADSKHRTPTDAEDERYSEDSFSQEELTPNLSATQRTNLSKVNTTQSDLDSTTSSVPISGLEHSLENFGALDTGLIRQKVLFRSGAKASDDEDGVLFGTTTVNPGALDLSDENHAYKDFDESLQSQGENSYGESSKQLYDSNEDIGAFIPSLTAYEPPSPPALKKVEHDFDLSNEAPERSVGSSLAESSTADISSMEILSKKFTDQYIQKALEVSSRLVERQAGVTAEPGAIAPADAGPSPDISNVSWTSGRAPMELIETAQAIDAYVSSLRLDGASLLLLGISRVMVFRNINLSICLHFSFDNFRPDIHEIQLHECKFRALSRC
jgi:hypothetical protein